MCHAGGTVCTNLFCGFAYNQIQIQLPVETGAQNCFTERFNFRANQWSSRWTIQQFDVINLEAMDQIIKNTFSLRFNWQTQKLYNFVVKLMKLLFLLSKLWYFFFLHPSCTRLEPVVLQLIIQNDTFTKYWPKLDCIMVVGKREKLNQINWLQIQNNRVEKLFYIFFQRFWR